MFKQIADRIHPNLTHRQIVELYLSEIDLTRIWPVYKKIGLFTRAYMYPEFGYILGEGKYAVVFKASPIYELDLLGTMCDERGFKNELARDLALREFGPYPKDEEAQDTWITNVIDRISPDALKVGIKYALNCQMLDFFDEIADASFVLDSNRKPSLKDQFETLARIDYGKLFELEFIKSFLRVYSIC